MAIRTFAAIDIGSYELQLKIFEVSKSRGIREVDSMVHRIELGTDTYRTGKITSRHVAEVKKTLLDFRRVMNVYGAKDYKAYGTSAFREMQNASVVLEQIELETGIHIDILSNSEQRFLDYKSIASKGELFNQVIEKDSAIVDFGGGSIQISLFNKDRLVTTQNLRLGVLRIHEQIHSLDAASTAVAPLISELVNAQILPFARLYLKDRTIRNIILVDDYLCALMQQRGISNLSMTEFSELMQRIHVYNRQNLARMLGVRDDNIPLIFISAVMLSRIAEVMKAENIYISGVTLCDGIVYEFAEKQKILPPSHDFEGDIIACAQNISKRYKGSPERSRTLESICLKIFDATKKIHGLSHREELLLRIAAILHDCGRYISMVNLAQCAYDIIMATEIIGLSHKEREIVANVVRYNHEPFVYYEQRAGIVGNSYASGTSISGISREDYLVIAKLTAILRIANGLDRSHRQKFENIRVQVKDSELEILVRTDQDITLEKGMFGKRAAFFEEIYGIRPVIRKKNPKRQTKSEL